MIIYRVLNFTGGGHLGAEHSYNNFNSMIELIFLTLSTCWKKCLI